MRDLVRELKYELLGRSVLVELDVNDVVVRCRKLCTLLQADAFA
jgi:hypothetical protein